MDNTTQTQGGINVEYVRDHVYHRYPRQTEPQGAFIYLDEDGELGADWNAEIGNAVPFTVWHGRTMRWTISPYLNADQINDLLDEVIPYAERIHAGHTVEWDGSNMVGTLTEDAERASCDIHGITEGIDGELVVYHVRDWFIDDGESEVLRLHKSGEDVSGILSAMEEEAIGSGVDVLETDGAEEWIQSIIDEHEEDDDESED